MTFFPAPESRMRRRVAARLAILGATAAAIGASIAACSASESDSGFELPHNDAGPADSTANNDAENDDSGGFDASMDSGPPPPTSLIAINASPDLWDFRLCFGYGTKDDGTDVHIARVPPFPNDPSKPIARSNFPGVPIGGGVAIPLADEMTTSLYVTPYVLKASKVAAVYPDKTCDELVECSAATCMAQNEYWPLTTIVPGKVVRGRTNFLVVSGCPPHVGDPNAGPDLCGPTYSPALGNLTVTIASAMIGDAARPSTLRAVFANVNSVASSIGPINASFGPLNPEAGATEPIATAYKFGDFSTGDGDFGFPIDASLDDFRAYGLTLRWTDLRDGGAGLDAGAGDSGDDAGDAAEADASPLRSLTMALDQIQSFSDPLVRPTDFYQRGPFLFAVVGDPRVPGGAASLDGSIGEDALRALHVVAIPAFPADTSAIDGGLAP